MAATDPTPAPVIAVPDSGKAADVTEPAIIAESGVTTSEWKLALAYLVQLAAAGTADVLAKVHFHLSDAAISSAANFEVIGAVVVASYVVSRGVRKFGVK